MQRSSLIGIILTLISAMLVLGAAFVFLFQGRRALDAEVSSLRQGAESLNQTITQMESTLATRDAEVGAAAATRAALDGELVGRQEEMGRLEEENRSLSEALRQQEAALAQLQAQALSGQNQPPLVVIFSPENGRQLLPSQSLPLVVSASDPAGIVELSVAVDGGTVLTHTAGERALVTVSSNWTPSITQGVQTITAVATNVGGLTSPPATVTVTIGSPEVLHGPLLTSLAENVAEVRGLEPQQPIATTFVTAAGWRVRRESLLGSRLTPEEARRQALVLSAFHFVPPDFDLYGAAQAQYFRPVTSFYDANANDLVVVSDSGPLDSLAQWAHIREVTHALQDQYYGLLAAPAGFALEDGGLARLALAEGDAAMTQFRYLSGAYFNDTAATEISQYLNRPEEAADGRPPLVRAAESFVETEGLRFVSVLFQSGDFAAVNDAWANPPVSTEHILHPDRYLANDLPQPVALPDLTATLGADWQRLDENTLGEFYLRQYLGQQLEAGSVNTAATGWGGDRYAVYHDEGSGGLVMVLRLVWDTTLDDDQFALAFTQFANSLTGNPGEGQPGGGRCWQTADVLCHFQSGEANLIVRAPDLAIARQLAAAAQNAQAQASTSERT